MDVNPEVTEGMQDFLDDLAAVQENTISQVQSINTAMRYRNWEDCLERLRVLQRYLNTVKRRLEESPLERYDWLAGHDSAETVFRDVYDEIIQRAASADADPEDVKRLEELRDIVVDEASSFDPRYLYDQSLEQLAQGYETVKETRMKLTDPFVGGVGTSNDDMGSDNVPDELRDMLREVYSEKNVTNTISEVLGSPLVRNAESDMTKQLLLSAGKRTGKVVLAVAAFTAVVIGSLEGVDVLVELTIDDPEGQRVMELMMTITVLVLIAGEVLSVSQEFFEAVFLPSEDDTHIRRLQAHVEQSQNVRDTMKNVLDILKRPS